MHEILTLSLSNKANHLATHFFNSQESYLDYTKGASHSITNPNVFLSSNLNRITNTLDFNPRAILWDFKNAFGSLNQYQYFESFNDDNNNNNNNNSYNWDGEIIKIQQSRIEKNDYQKYLDGELESTKLQEIKLKKNNLLGLDNTLYWSDYSRVIYDRNSFNNLNDWEYHPIHYPNGKLKFHNNSNENRNKVPFNDFDQGVLEYDKVKLNYNEDYIENNIRYFIEKCDNLSGLNLIIDIDSGWPGLLNQFLEFIKDDYLNKKNLFTYGLFNNNVEKNKVSAGLISRIKSLVTILDSSTMFFPIDSLPKISKNYYLNNSNYNNKSSWHNAAIQFLNYENLNILFCDKKLNISMSHIENSLNIGSNRNIVGDINSIIVDNSNNSNSNYTIDYSSSFFELELGNKRFQDKFNKFKNKNRQNKTFNKIYVSRTVLKNKNNEKNINEEEEKENSKRIDDIIEKDQNKLISNGTNSNNLSKLHSNIGFLDNDNDSFPMDDLKLVKENDNLISSYSINDFNTRTYLNKLNFIVQNTGNRFFKMDDKEEKIDQLGTFAQEYEFGYNSDDDYDDFDSDYY
ncbi:Dml1p [Ascoidea rubescens DSM 1968]|uniref:Protein DML1 n=1 Tax=Ascoidea rubescens DSM 1968 TaxID=1344418 RepID=A0A1D2VEE6_9ASCO|nr:tubulin nucleotide-binding domain-like protein [Ascoidea rubescens DSM 1968]ODV59873.1 tubulin nucleotide-binding domain-like protein [Ascoidea rubescens DSM 1968]